MPKNLVIVESPAKAKTIQKFLGKDFHVTACMGHVRDLPKTKLGIDLENNFEPKYLVLQEKTDLIKQLTQEAKKVEKVFLATDLDREGEAIAWHLAEALKIPPNKASRVIFNEITRPAIQAAFRTPLQIQMSKVYAQQARRILDRIVGYQLSPLLWEKILRGLSAGRVQSVAVRLIVEKEKEIRAFKSEEYWKIVADLLPKGGRKTFESELKKYQNDKIQIPNETAAQAILAELKKLSFEVSQITRKEKFEKPLPPFATSQLQQQASIQLGFSTKHTMMVAQQLYEGLEIGSEGSVGLITYMRTDSFQVSQEAIKECREFIQKNYPSNYLPEKSQQYTNKKSQGAHEAIRPSSITRTPSQIKEFLTSDQYRLYKLIWDRFVASQMSPACIALTNIIIHAGKYEFESKGRQVLFPGYQILTTKSNDDEKENELPELQENQELACKKITPSQHFTQPPARYSEATLVKSLETNGIGRPSTYAPIISTIQERGYVTLKDRAFHASDLGIKVTDQLTNYFPKIIDTEFTCQMEDKLDQIEDSQINWDAVVSQFYSMFSKDLEIAYKNMTDIKKNPEVSDCACPKCGNTMVVKYNKRGKFLGCSKYPECKTTVSLDANGNPLIPVETDYVCEKCGKKMVMRDGKRGKFLACSGYPDCKNILGLGLDGKPKPAIDTSSETCPECGAAMVQRQGRHGIFLACSRYPECKGTKSLGNFQKLDYSKIVNKVCDKCEKKMTIRRGRGGFFFGCTGYPKCKNVLKFSLDGLNIPETLKNKTCPTCNNPLEMSYDRSGLFLKCSNKDSCNFRIACELAELVEEVEKLNPSELVEKLKKTKTEKILSNSSKAIEKDISEIDVSQEKISSTKTPKKTIISEKSSKKKSSKKDGDLKEDSIIKKKDSPTKTKSKVKVVEKKATSKVKVVEKKATSKVRILSDEKEVEKKNKTSSKKSASTKKVNKKNTEEKPKKTVKKVAKNSEKAKILEEETVQKKKTSKIKNK